MPDIQSTESSPSDTSTPSRVVDHRTTPAGVMPRRLQQWVILGIAVVMMAILALAGPTQPSKPSSATATTTAPLAVDPNQQRIEEYQRRVQEQAQRLAAEQAQLDLTKEALNLGATGANGAAGGLPPGASPGSSSYPSNQPAPYPSSSSSSGREPNTPRVSDNVAFSRTAKGSGADGAGGVTGSPSSASNAANMANAANLIAALTAGQQNPFVRTAGQSGVVATIQTQQPADANEAGEPADTASSQRPSSPQPAWSAAGDGSNTSPGSSDARSSRNTSVASSNNTGASFGVVPPTARDTSADSVAQRTGSAAGRPFRLSEGTLIETALTNRLDGTFSGPVNVLVTVPVYSGRVLLIPAGARLLGDSSPVTTLGQRRLAVKFHRLLFPTGERIDLNAFPGLDQAGDLGLTDPVDGHYGRIFGTSIALGLLGGLTQARTSAGLDATGEDRYRQGVASSIGQSGTRVLDRFLNMLPTVTIREGHRIKVYLTRDLELPAYRPQAAVAGGVRP